MYTLHIANKNYSSWSLRPWLLMTELGIEFNEQLHFFNDGTNWSEFRKFAPNGRVPCLVSRIEGQAQTVWDSLAITEYLAESHTGVWPCSQQARTWARCASAEMHAGFGNVRNNCPMNVSVRIAMNDISGSFKAELDRIDELWQEGICRFGGPFLAGANFSAVDAFFAPVVFRIRSYGLPVSQTSAQYIETVLNLPGMKGWIAAALKEPAEPSHEADCIRHGRLISDARH